MMPNFETGPLKTDGFLPKEREKKEWSQSKMFGPELIK